MLKCTCAYSWWRNFEQKQRTSERTTLPVGRWRSEVARCDCPTGWIVGSLAGCKKTNKCGNSRITYGYPSYPFSCNGYGFRSACQACLCLGKVKLLGVRRRRKIKSSNFNRKLKAKPCHSEFGIGWSWKIDYTKSRLPNDNIKLNIVDICIFNFSKLTNKEQLFKTISHVNCHTTMQRFLLKKKRIHWTNKWNQIES